MRTILGWVMVLVMGAFAGAAEPTEMREWRAASGHTVEAKALGVLAGKVQLQKADGSKVVVPLDKFAEADQKALREHFGVKQAAAVGDGAAPVEGAPADDLPFPLGKTTDEVSCGDKFSYFLYLPKSLNQGVKHPVLFVMSPGGGGAGNVGRYKDGAERNRWIVAVSKQSKNGYIGSQNAINSMIQHVTKTLPIDEKRMYVSGFSGGSRMAFSTSKSNKKIAGVLACGAGGDVGSSKQVVYGLCGSNCFNRNDMANSFKGFKNKDCLLRYFVGKHAWANAELCDDGINHLNGVFLIKNKSKYADAYADYVSRVVKLIEEIAESSPMRAYMWSSFLTERGVQGEKLAELHKELGKDDFSMLYVEGLEKVSEFAQKQFGSISSSQWKANEKVASACMREARKYRGTPWAAILEKMAEDAQKF